MSRAFGGPGARYRRLSVVLTDDQHRWAWRVVDGGARQGLNCSVSDLVQLALFELRGRYPSPRGLAAALRGHVWRELAVDPDRASRPPARPGRAVRVGSPQGASRSPIRVLLVEGGRISRQRLATGLREARDVELAGAVADGQAGLRLLDRVAVGVVLLDLSLPDDEGAELVSSIVAAHPEVRVLVVAGSDAPARERALAALEAGAAGCLLADADPGELLAAVRGVARGESTPALRALWSWLAEAPRRPPAPLTDRERDVLGLVGRGLANKQIARRLGISEKTVKAHLGRAYQRLGVADRTQAALWAERNGLLKV